MLAYLLRPQRGLHDALGPLGRAFLKPRPMGVVDYCCIGLFPRVYALALLFGDGDDFGG